MITEIKCNEKPRSIVNDGKMPSVPRPIAPQPNTSQKPNFGNGVKPPKPRPIPAGSKK